MVFESCDSHKKNACKKKYQGFLMFSRSAKWKHWPEMGLAEAVVNNFSTISLIWENSKAFEQSIPGSIIRTIDL